MLNKRNTCVYRKPKPGRNGDEARLGSRVNLLIRSAERSERPLAARVAHLVRFEGYGFW
jgi:hypothetical protein